MANLIKQLIAPLFYDVNIDPEFRAWIDTLYNYIAEVELPHEVGTFGEPPFQNGWLNIGTPFNNAGFYIDPFMNVSLSGVIGTGTLGTVAFTLPVGYRPNNTVRFNGAVSVDNLGQVTPLVNGDLDGISFRVD